MSSRSKALDFLESIQGNVYRRIGRPPLPTADDLVNLQNHVLEEALRARVPFLDSEGIRKLRSEMRSSFEEDAGISMPTRYEDRLSYLMILDLAEEIEQVVRQLGYSMQKRPVIGTLTSGTLNAMALPVPSSDEYLVVFEGGIFDFANLMSNVVSLALPFRGMEQGNFSFSSRDRDVDRAIRERPDIPGRFQEVLLAYLLHGRANFAPPHSPEEPHAMLAGFLTHSMELFILGHEYGHIISGHLDRPQKFVPALEGKGIKQVKEIEYGWTQELEADERGLELMLAAMRRDGTDPALSYWGTELFFSCVEIVERGVSVIAKGKESERPPTWHPPPARRRENLRRKMKGSVGREAAKPAMEVGKTVQRIIENLWRTTRPSLRKLHEQKERPAPSWR